MCGPVVCAHLQCGLEPKNLDGTYLGRETTVKHGFGSRRNVTGFAVNMVVTHSETDSVKFNDASAYRNTIFL